MDKTRNVKLEALLNEHGYTHQGLADAINQTSEDITGEATNCTDRHVRRWISGHVQWPWSRYLLPLQEILGCTPEAMGFTPRGATSQAPTRPVQPTRERKPPVRRREFIAVGLAATLGLDAIPTTGRLGASDAGRIRALVPALYKHDHALGGGALHQVAAEALARVHDALNSCTYGERVERQLYAAAGDLAASAGWFAYDAGQQQAATDLYREALQSAMLAADGQLQARVWSNLAMQARLLDRDQEAVRIGRAAVETRQAKNDAWLMALLHCRQAVGHARMGERARAERSLARAETAYGKTSGEPSAWLTFLTPAEILGLAGAARAALGQHRQAAELTVSALDQLEPRFERNRIYYTVQHAQALLGGGEVEGAVGQARAALGLQGRVQSERVKGKLSTLQSGIGRYRSLPVVQGFLEEMREA